MNGGQAIHFAIGADGHRLAYAVTGRGPPLLRAPTWLNDIERDWDSPVYGHWLKELSRNHTLVRFDARGVGMSDRQAEVSFDGWVQDMSTIADSIGLQKFGVVASSYGAAIAIAYAAGHQERVERMFLVGACCRGALKRGPEALQTAEEDVLVRLIELGWNKEHSDFRQVFTARFIPGATQVQKDWFTESMRLATSPANAARYQRMTQRIDVLEPARSLKCEALLLHSLHDAMVPHEEGKVLATAIPKAGFVTLTSVNHIILEHEPAWARARDEFRGFMAPGGAGSQPALVQELERLSAREREVLILIARGLTNEEIAGNLSLSKKTVSNHLTRIFAKITVKNRAQAIVRAHQAGLHEAFGLPDRRLGLRS